MTDVLGLAQEHVSLWQEAFLQWARGPSEVPLLPQPKSWGLQDP